MEVIVDRFEGEYAIVEVSVGQFVQMPKVLVSGAKEGDVIKITVDKEASQKRKENIQNLMNNLFED